MSNKQTSRLMQSAGLSAREQDQAPIVTVPRSEAAGSVGRQIREQWSRLRDYLKPYEGWAPPTAHRDEIIRKLDALIGYDDAK